MGARMRPAVIAIDGGNSKTEVLVISEDGVVLGTSRGPGASPQNIGVRGLCRGAGRHGAGGVPRGWSATKPFAKHTSAYLAGADLPREEEVLQRGAVGTRAGGTHRASATTPSRCCGRAAPTGSASQWCAAPGSTASASARTAACTAFPRWAGSPATGVAATGSAKRRCGAPCAPRTAAARGPRCCRRCSPTSAKPTLAGGRAGLHFEEITGGVDPRAVPAAVRSRGGRGDEVAADDRRRGSSRRSACSRRCPARAWTCTASSVDIVLGGGVLTRVGAPVIAEIERRCLKVAPRAVVRVVDVNPVVGAALFGLDTLGALRGREGVAEGGDPARLKTLAGPASKRREAGHQTFVTAPGRWSRRSPAGT